MPLNCFYTTVQKSQKWPKTQIKGGPALNNLLVDGKTINNKHKAVTIGFFFKTCFVP